jgi:MFS family permease
VQYLLLYFHRVCPAVLAPEFVRDFHMSGVGLGLLTSAYFYPYTVMQVPVGVLSDRWGVRKTVI